MVMMTAYSVENLIQQALEEGAYGILYKPLGIEKVVELIEKRKQAQKDAFILVVDDDPEAAEMISVVAGRCPGRNASSRRPGSDRADWAHHLQSSEQPPSFPAAIEQILTPLPNRSVRRRWAQ